MSLGVNIIGMYKAKEVTAHNAITATATSSAVDCKGFRKAILTFDITGSGDWTLTVNKSDSTGTTIVAADSTVTGGVKANVTADTWYILDPAPDWITITATENSGTATVTVKVQPYN